MAEDYQKLIDKCIQMGADGAKLIDTGEIFFDPRSHLKCSFGCNRWGKFWTCPPHNGISQEMFMDSFSKYKVGLIIKTADPKMGQDISLAVEKEALLSHGAVFAFALALCVKCDECSYPDPCRFPDVARPSMDAYGMDIVKTVEIVGFKVEFNEDGQMLPAWYSMVLLD